MEPNAGPQVLIVNQHGDNRGDEAAMRAMLNGLAERLPGARFTVVHQFNDPDVSCVDVEQDVTYLPINIPILDAGRLALAELAGRCGLDVGRMAGPTAQRLRDAYDAADLVVSAPGGPYFGDIYGGHEPVHWFYIWMAHRRGLPLVLYAPSVGPFDNRLLNRMRRRGFGWFDDVTVREDRSAEMLRALVPGLEVVVTADSALQQPVSGSGSATDAPDRPLRIVGALRRADDDGADAKDAAYVEGLAALARERPIELVLLPQVHGVHRDAPYQQGLVDALIERGVDAQLADEVLDSNQQRRLIADADVVIAGRYHPAVFAVSAGVPVLVIPYEHKSVGLADAAGLDEWTLDLDDLDATRLETRLQALVDRSDEVRSTLGDRGSELSARAAGSSDRAAALLGPPTGDEKG